MPIYEFDKPFFDVNMAFFVSVWKKYVEKYSTIEAITKPFATAAIEAQPKMKPIFDEIDNDRIGWDISKTFLFEDKVLMSYYHVEAGLPNESYCFFLFEKSGIPLALVRNDLTDLRLGHSIWISNRYKVNKDEKAIESRALLIKARALIFDVFERYARVETKHLAPGQKIKGIDCNYKNETKSPVTIRDSTWFTNLVKSDAFKVRGHFRLQPKKKDGEWTKELIWISDFMKTGYTSPARKTKEGAL